MTCVCIYIYIYIFMFIFWQSDTGCNQFWPFDCSWHEKHWNVKFKLLTLEFNVSSISCGIHFTVKGISLHSGLISLHSGFNTLHIKPQARQISSRHGSKDWFLWSPEVEATGLHYSVSKNDITFVFLTHGAPGAILVPRFLRSLATKVEDPHDVQKSDARPMPKAASSSDSRTRFFKALKEEKLELGDGDLALEKQKVAVTVNFSLESLLQFKEDNLLHTTAAVTSSAPPRKRPNYDNRKRKFMANQPAERRE